MKNHILAVDDNPTDLEGFQICLSEAGFQVSVAKTGEEAIEKIRSEGFGLLLLDINLPGDASGAQVAWAARQKDSQVPIVAVSANLSVWEEEDLRELGFGEILEKPVAPEKLLAVVRSKLGRPASTESFPTR